MAAFLSDLFRHAFHIITAVHARSHWFLQNLLIYINSNEVLFPDKTGKIICILYAFFNCFFDLPFFLIIFALK